MIENFNANHASPQLSQFFAYLAQHYVSPKPKHPLFCEEILYERFDLCDPPKVKLSKSESKGRFRIREKLQPPQDEDLNNRLLALMESQKEESFINALHTYIRQRWTTAPIIYRRAHLDRRHFSKIISQQITPSKDAAIALALALKLNLEETQAFIGKAGYTLTHSEKRDILIEYCITQKTYDIDEVNALLIHFDQAPLREK